LNDATDDEIGPAVGHCGYEIKGPSCPGTTGALFGSSFSVMLSFLFFLFLFSLISAFWVLLLYLFQNFFKPPYVCTVHGASNIGRGSRVVTM